MTDNTKAGLTPVERALKKAVGITQHKKSLRVAFTYKEKPRRETVKIAVTVDNIRMLSKNRGCILAEIAANGYFDYIKYFPDGKNGDQYQTSKLTRKIELSALINEFLISKQKDAGPDSIYTYRTQLAKLKNKLGAKVILSDLYPKNVDLLIVELKNELAAKTINNHLKIYKQLFNYAYINQHITHRLQDRCKSIKEKDRQPDPFDANEIRTLIQCVPLLAKNIKRKLVLPWSNMIEFNCNMGLRPGELISLAWQDELEPMSDGRLVFTIKRNLSRSGFKLPKHDKTRTIVLTHKASKAINKQRRITAANPLTEIKKRVEEGVFITENISLVFLPKSVSKYSGKLIDKMLSITSMGNQWRELIKLTGLRFRSFSKTRCTAATFMLMSKQPAKRVAGILGNTEAVLLTYYSAWIEYNNSDYASLSAGEERSIRMAQSSLTLKNTAAVS